MDRAVFRTCRLVLVASALAAITPACKGARGRGPEGPAPAPKEAGPSAVTSTAAPAAEAAPGPGGVERVTQGNRITENVPAIPPELLERMRRYLESRRADVAGWDASGKGIYLRTRFGSTAQLHVVRQPLGARTQLTFYAEPVGSAAPSPDPSRRGVMFTMDRGGDEYTQIHWYDEDTREVTMLTDGKSRNGNLAWSDDGKRVAYTSTRRNGRDFDLWTLDPANPSAPHQLIYEAQGLWAPLDWSPEGDRLLVMRYVSQTKSELHVLEPGRGLVQQITPVADTALDVSMGGGVFSADGQGVFYLSDAGGERSGLRFHDLKTKKDTLLSEGQKWDLTGIGSNKARTLLSMQANEGGYSKLKLFDPRTRKFRPDPQIPKGIVSGTSFSPDGRALAFTFESGKSAGDLYVLQLASGKVTRWTESEVGGLDPAKFHEPELIEYPTFDQVEGGGRRMIPAFVTLPDGPGPHPVVINIHGGPEAQWRPWFAPFFELLVSELGFAVISPNVRGSTGYGRAYTLLDNGDKREDSVKDIGALLDWIATQPNLDKSRVGLFGGSYGGYMVLASGAHYGDRIAAIVDVVGISNFVTFLESTKEYRRDLRRVEYGDERDPKMRAFLEEISPTKNAHRITAPLFVAQGANDPRVPQGEAEQIVKVVRAQGKDVWYLLFTDEGHGFQKKDNRDFFSAATVMFLQKHLGGGSK